MKRLTIALSAAMLLATSAHAAEFLDSTYTTYKKLPPYRGEVSVLNSTPPIGRYIELGIVRVKSNAVRDYDTALVGLKQAAAAHGATAIVLQPDAQLSAQGRTTDRGTKPEHISAMAITQD